jgi:glycerol kinase
VLGAAYLAGQRIGVYGSPLEFSEIWQCDARFEPSLDMETREQWLAGWRSAVRRVLSVHDGI